MSYISACLSVCPAPFAKKCNTRWQEVLKHWKFSISHVDERQANWGVILTTTKKWESASFDEEMRARFGDRRLEHKKNRSCQTAMIYCCCGQLCQSDITRTNQLLTTTGGCHLFNFRIVFWQEKSHPYKKSFLYVVYHTFLFLWVSLSATKKKVFVAHFDLSYIPVL